MDEMKKKNSIPELLAPSMKKKSGGDSMGVIPFFMWRFCVAFLCVCRKEKRNRRRFEKNFFWPKIILFDYFSLRDGEPKKKNRFQKNR
jgi:hypothetical protein